MSDEESTVDLTGGEGSMESGGESTSEGESGGASGESTDEAVTGSEREATARDEPSSADGAREVTVPLRLYKTVTVFATLIAMVAVILGFLALDAATNRAQAAASEVDVWLALLGLASILLGAFVYAFSTRFRTPEMGKSKDESAEDSNNG
jgi:uncharacterized membrane protein